MSTQDETAPTSELVLYRTEDAETRVQVRLDGQSVRLTQRQMADLYLDAILAVG